MPVVQVEHESFTAGGAANVALNLAGLGVTTEVFGLTGRDEAGDRLDAILTAAGITTRRSPRSVTTPTIIKTRVVARTQQLCRIDREAPRQSFSIPPDCMPSLTEAIADADAVILSDYAKGVLDQNVIDTVLSLAKHDRKLVAADPKPSCPLVYHGVGLLTPNRSEALRLAGMDDPPRGAPYPVEAVCRRIYEAHAPDLLVVTLGADGMAISREGLVTAYLPTQAREVFDVSGAGDTVIATLTAALVAGATAPVAAALANLAAGIVVGHMGTVPISRTELEGH